MMPLVFTPHGIFMGEMKAQRSIVTSVNLCARAWRHGIFFIFVILIGYGLDMLWSTPGRAESWMMLVGSLGMVLFPALVAASFVFCDGLAWLSEVVRSKEIQKARQADL